jgi:Cu2+-exporting ATPase
MTDMESHHDMKQTHEHGEQNTDHVVVEHKHDRGHVDHTGHEVMFRNRFWVCLVLSIPVLLYSPTIQGWLGFGMPEFTGSEWIVPVLSLIIFIIGGVPFLRLAVPEIRKRKPGMMTLISLAIGVSFLYSYAALVFDLGDGFFWELVTLIDVMLLGHWLEMRSVRQASGALQELAKLMPDTAERLRDDGSFVSVRVEALRREDIVLIRPGASVPADGMVVEGGSDVNESMITGESRPVRKRVGDTVIGGTINGEGSLRVRVTATGEDTALAGVMRLVEEAQMSKSETQVLADKAAGWLFYGAVGVAILTAIAWTVAIGFNEEVVARVATVLVIACPHALGLAIPLVVAISTSMGAKNGILVRNRMAVEEARDIDIVIFDKTGTLTRGEFGVVDEIVAESWTHEQALALTTAVEADSEHSIAHALRNQADSRNLELPDVTEFKALMGRGVQAIYDSRKVYVGGPRLLEMLDVRPAEAISEFGERNEKSGRSVVYLIIEDAVVAAYALADVVRPESKIAVQELQKMGIEVAMLTGDSRDVAESVAKELNIQQYFAEVLPQDKDTKVSDLQSEGLRVAMVGDGVNDAPALTRADVGIAIGSGTDVAVESADVVLVKNDPRDVVRVISLSKASYRKMVENLVWATGYNIIAIPLAAGLLAPFGILLSPAVGALLMSLSTVIVALNAQTLRRAKI